VQPEGHIFPDPIEILRELNDMIIFRAVFMAAFMYTVADLSSVLQSDIRKKIAYFT